MEDNEESPGLGCALEGFKEYDEVMSNLVSLRSIYKDRQLAERALEKTKAIMDLYQEQSHLLDQYLDRLLSVLLAYVRDGTTNCQLLRNEAFKFLYLLTKTRGAKVIVRHMPHEIGDLQLILKLLSEQNPTDPETWCTRYMLIIWLSIVVMIPIHLVRLDAGIGQNSTLDKILSFVKIYLSTTDKTQTAGPILAGRFLTRPDAKVTHLPQFIDWALEMIDDKLNTKPHVRETESVLSALAQLFKHGKREDMKEYGSRILQKILKFGCTDDNNNNVRKNALKLIQRIGLTFMRVKIAHWRYCRGSRSLVVNLSSNVNGFNETPAIAVIKEDEEYQIPDEIEEIIEQLFKGLKDEAHIARWSAAKGMGRVTERLPQELADDVISNLLDMFHMREGENAWHGGCLALAELARRGLLLPQHLDKVMPILSTALVYDELKGNFSAGSNIRDAACYVCWAFARAYEKEVLEPYIEKLSQGLIITAIFDREVSCRRAASAAFQENVGRQGTFPNGIEILTSVDYFTVSQISNSYLHLSVYVAQFPKYSIPIIDHLVERKISHCDIRIRELASQALHKLTSTNRNYVVNTVLPKLVPLATGFDTNSRHGSILSIAEIIEALSNSKSGEENLQKRIGNDTLNGIRGIAAILQEKKMFRGLGGEMFRSAISIFIHKLSKSKLLDSDDWQVLDLWKDTLYEFLTNKDAGLRLKASVALSEICSTYYSNEKSKCLALVKDCFVNLLSHHQEIRCGYGKLLGGLPIFMLVDNPTEVINKLIDCARSTKKEEELWVESRSVSIDALIEVLQTVGVRSVSDEITSEIYDCLFASLTDYTMDSRGDIGSLVRITALNALKNLTVMVASHKQNLLEPDLVSKMFCKFMQLSVEGIDRVRAASAEVLIALLNSSPSIPNIPHYDRLKGLFTEEACKDVIWKNHSETYPLFVQLMNEQTYTYHLLLGFSISIGGKITYLIKFASTCFLGYLTTIKSDAVKLGAIESAFLKLLNDHLKDNRVIVPLMIMADFLINSGAFDNTDPNQFPYELLNVCYKVGGSSKVAPKVLALVDILSGLINFKGRTRTKAVSSLSIFLVHQYPKVRSRAAQKLYESIITAGDVVADEYLDELMNVLTETDWAANVDKQSFKPIRNKVCQLMDIALPPVSSAKA